MASTANGRTWRIAPATLSGVSPPASVNGTGDAAAAAARIDSQMPLEEKLKRANVAIDSSGTIEQTREKLRRLWEERT